MDVKQVKIMFIIWIVMLLFGIFAFSCYGLNESKPFSPEQECERLKWKGQCPLLKLRDGSIYECANGDGTCFTVSKFNCLDNCCRIILKGNEEWEVYRETVCGLGPLLENDKVCYRTCDNGVKRWWHFGEK